MKTEIAYLDEQELSEMLHEDKEFEFTFNDIKVIVRKGVGA